ncbi:hypothetical protein GCM10009069_05450 [Algimonas arctica]|uniref:non-specific protein-tyrosine kinase n=1 Tax=Algimonas arctica TaxID=1479486 RepID=A0A8J3CM08_9PROT|nr:hypothetical protein GCM10009069_05450 [Algimonas arctica]
MYKASASIEIQKQENQIVDGAAEPGFIADAEFMATQYELLQSRVLAERVVNSLGLVNDPSFVDQSLDRVTRREVAARKIQENIRVEPEGRSRLVKVTYISPGRNEAASIANAIVDNFIESTLERRYNATAYARKFLTERIVQSRTALEQFELEVVGYAEDAGILDVPTGENRTTPLEASTILSLNAELAQAQSRTTELEQAYLAARDSSASEQTLKNSEIQELMSEKRELEDEYQQLIQSRGPSHPDVLNIQSRLDAINPAIAEIKAQIIAAEEAKFLAAQTQEAVLRQRFNELRSNLSEDRTKRVNYTILQRNVDTARSQYDALLQRLKEVSIAGGVGSSQISVVDRALPPRVPFEPSLTRNVLQAVILSLALGVGLAFGLSFIDDTIKVPDDIKKALSLPVLAVVPKTDEKEGSIADQFSNPRSAVAEAYYSGRTALEFSSESGTPKSIILTSTNPGEGKSSTVMALGIAFSKIGKKVLIIDADMRKPSFVADKADSIGLSGLLTSKDELSENIISSKMEGLYLLPSGVIPPNPSQIISSDRLRQIIREAEGTFDLVLVDAPPVLGLTDALTLSSVCQATIVVMKSGKIRKPSARRTVDRLKDVNANIIGAVLNQFDAKRTGYDSGYYYYAYGDGAYAYGAADKSSSKIKALRKINLFTEK